DSQIADCVVADNTEIGILLQGSSRNRLTANTITGGKYGIQLYRAGDNALRQNTMTGCLYGFHCTGDPSWAAHWRQDVTPDNTVNGKSIYYLVGAKGTVIDGPSNAGCVYAVECSGITVRDVALDGNYMGATFLLTDDSTIENVTAGNNEYAGIALYNSSNNVLRGNSASGSTCGVIVRTDSLLLKNPKRNLIDRCSVSFNKIGINIDPSTDIENCCVACNSEWGIEAGGIRVANCTIFGNGGGAYEKSWTGGLHLYNSTTPSTIVNSILWANTRNQIMLEHTTADVTHCVVQGGYPGEGNLSSDPEFTPDGHLTKNSPCIGAGRGKDCPLHDLDGEPRDPNGPVGIGCDQFVDADVDGLPDGWELAYFGDRTAARPDEDPDEDGHDNIAEYELYSSDPTTPAAVYYVDANRPDDVKGGAAAMKGVSQTMGNINVDPLFVAPGKWDSTPSTDFGNSTAHWIEGDYRLKSAGWRWSPSPKDGSHWVRDDVTSRCIDAGNPGAILGEEPIAMPDEPSHNPGRNLRIDMGAYGGTREASMAPRGWAILTDTDNDGRVDLRDFARWAAAFRSRQETTPSDATRNGRVDYADLSRLAADWLDTTSWPR
ncbi:MAG: NosD domain-containing protein, partial [Phycisphaerales bacterium]